MERILTAVPEDKRKVFIIGVIVLAFVVVLRTAWVVNQPFEVIHQNGRLRRDIHLGGFDHPEETGYEEEDEEAEEDEGDKHGVPMRDGKRVSEVIADNKIRVLRELLGDSRGPIVVGGIGDSGTRGAWEVLFRLGVYMQGGDKVRGDSKDSIVFMSRRPTQTSAGKMFMRNPSGLYNEGIRRSNSLKYGPSHVTPEHWQLGRQFIADTVQRIVNDTMAKRKGLDPFGFKHPRTALILPYFVATLGNQFAFVHVLRDGREVSAGDNNHLFLDHCEPYYGIRTCNDWKAIEMWADLNRDVFEYFLESPSIKADQYFAIRVEDLVSGDLTCYQNLARFLQIPKGIFNARNFTERMQRAVSSSVRHSKSYFGGHYTYHERENLINNVHKLTRAKEALKFWGYADTKFALEKNCTELPWVALMRERKGPLPWEEEEQ